MNEQPTHRWYQLKLWHLLLLALVASCLAASRPWVMVAAAWGRHAWGRPPGAGGELIVSHEFWLYAGPRLIGPIPVPPTLQTLGVLWLVAATATLVTTATMLCQQRPTRWRSLWLALCLASCVAAYLPYAALTLP